MKHLTKEQRYQIKAYLHCGKSKTFIAKALGVDRTTIYREIKRNSTKRGTYNPNYAHELAFKTLPKLKKLAHPINKALAKIKIFFFIFGLTPY